METGKTKLPPSTPGRLILLLLGVDLSLAGLILAIIYASALWRSVATVAVIVFVAVSALFVAHLVRQGRGEEMLFSLGRAAWLLAATLFWAVGAGLIVLALGFGIAMSIPAATPLLLYALVFFSVLLMTWSAAKAAIRRRRMLLILSNVEKAMRMDMPIPRMILAAADGETGIMRKRLLALHDHLDRGEPLDQALIYSVPEVPYSTIRLIAAGQHMGCLQHVLEGILRRRSSESTGSSPSASFYWAYPVVLLMVICLIFIFVIPKYQSIFRDFHLDLPPITKAMLHFFNDSSAFGVLAFLLALIPLGRALSELFPSFRAVAPFGGVLTDYVIWWTPFFGGFASDRGMADLCDIVAAGVQTGHPLDESLQQAAAAQRNAVLRYRAGAWAQAVTQGQALHEAARYARMPELFTSMLATVRTNESLLQVLGFLWRHYEYRVNRTRAVIQALYVPVIVLSLGTLVGLIGMSLMQPLVRMSEHLSGTIMNGGF